MTREGISFLAIDFETANHKRNSACAVGTVLVEKGEIVRREYHLIRPPTREFTFTHIHGLTWDDVSDALSFGELWPKIRTSFKNVDFLAAHNAPFDRSVLRSCCLEADIDYPAVEFRCTVQVSRRVWGIFPTRLPDVCTYLDIPLNHQEAASDSEACARIMIEAMKGHDDE